MKHDLNVKSNLLQVYSQDLDECESSQGGTEIVIESPSRSFRSTSSNSFHINWESLHEQVCELQEENKRLRQEANNCITDLESEEKKELQLIQDCTKQLCKFVSFVPKINMSNMKVTVIFVSHLLILTLLPPYL